MRLVSLGMGGLLLVGLAAVYYVFFDLREVHVAATVPGDFSFGLFYSSIDDLRSAYEGPYARRDADAGRLRLGARVNVPELNGIAHHRPAAVFWTKEAEEIWVVPYTDFDEFTDAFDVNRANTRLRPPQRVARNYLSVSESRARADLGPDNPLVLRAVEYPLALAGHPRDAKTVVRMLAYLFAHEPAQKPERVRILGREVMRLPRTIAEFIARECDDFLLGFLAPQRGAKLVHAEIEATPAPGGILARVPDTARGLDVDRLAATFPQDTVVLVGAALDAAAWREIGPPWDVGDAAMAFGVVHTAHRARRFTLLCGVRPRDAAALERLHSEGGPALIGALGDAPPETLVDQGTTIRSVALAKVPPGWETLLRSAAKVPPPVYVSTATENGVWYCAVGSQALQVVRHALGCARRATELSILRYARSVGHPEMLQGDPTAVALLRPEGADAFGYTMPMIELLSLSAPQGITAVLHTGGQVRVDLRIQR